MKLSMYIQSKLCNVFIAFFFIASINTYAAPIRVFVTGASYAKGITMIEQEWPKMGMLEQLQDHFPKDSLQIFTPNDLKGLLEHIIDKTRINKYVDQIMEITQTQRNYGPFRPKSRK